MEIVEQIILSDRNSIGITVSAYKRSRFSSDPVAGSPLPDVNPADATSVVGQDQRVEFATLPVGAFWLTWVGVLRQWRLIEGPTAASIPAGGTIHQVLSKQSNTDYDVDWEDAAGGGGGSTKLVDLGVINAVDLLAGPKTLYTLPSPQLVEVFLAADGFAVFDGPFVTARLGDLSAGVATPGAVSQTGTLSAGVGYESLLAATASRGSGRVYQAGDVVVACAVSGLNDLPILAVPPAWVAVHAYAAEALILASGHYWSNSGGTSAGTISDFPANFNGSVADGSGTWLDEGAIASVGSIHLYALVATPVAP